MFTFPDTKDALPTFVYEHRVNNFSADLIRPNNKKFNLVICYIYKNNIIFIYKQKLLSNIVFTVHTHTHTQITKI